MTKWKVYVRFDIEMPSKLPYEKPIDIDDVKNMIATKLSAMAMQRYPFPFGISTGYSGYPIKSFRVVKATKK